MARQGGAPRSARRLVWPLDGADDEKIGTRRGENNPVGPGNTAGDIAFLRMHFSDG